MEAKLTIQERLKDLRVVDQGLSLEQLAWLGIDYDAITKERFVTLLDILAKSKKLQICQASRRGKSRTQSHGKGKRKK